MGLEILPQHRDHSRSYHQNRYVYPVLSRRSRGISIGVNLNPDKVCNFACIYCQVDRTTPPTWREVDETVLLEELRTTAALVTGGQLYEDPAFAAVPPPCRRLNDVAFSGDGEPTAYPGFGAVVEQVARWREEAGLAEVKLVVITNATRFHRPVVQQALDTLMAHNGAIWAKLDAGTEASFQRIERTRIAFAQVLANLTSMAQRHPLTIQSLFLREQGLGPDEAEITAYIGRLQAIVRAEGRLQGVQIYTVARRPAESTVTALSDAEVESIAARVRAGLRVGSLGEGLPREPIVVETYYGIG